MSFKITVFIGDQTNTTNGETYEYSNLEELSKYFSFPTQGKKHSAYFVRGALEPMERKDDNIAESRLIILDADSGPNGTNAPAPEEMHSALVKLDLSHFIYTSHSHSAEKNKYRVVIPCDKPIVRADLRRNVLNVLDQLDKEGVIIDRVKEMAVWSQPWFVPTRDDIEDGLFRFYGYNGEEWNVKKVKTENETSEKKTSKEADNVGLTDKEAIKVLETGDGIHQLILNQSKQFAKEGVSKEFNYRQMVMKIESSSLAMSRPERLAELVDEEGKATAELKRIVDGAYVDDTPFELDGLSKEKIAVGKGMPKPPGLLGELYNSAFDFLLLQSEEVAMASAVGTVAGIIGRKFNVNKPMPTGLNIFMTVIAKTGCGKDRINDFARMCLLSAQNGVKSYDSFLAPSHFYGPKAIVDHFINARSGLSIISESGLMMKIKSGNVEAKTAFMLDALQCSHSHGYTKAHGYSKAEDSLPAVRAMAMSVISESTPGQMMEAYSQTGALTSGYLPRQVCLRVTKDITKSNRNIIDQLSSDLSDRIHDLCETCSVIQAEVDPDPYILEFESGLLDDYHDYFDFYLDIKNTNAGIDEIKSNMASRVAQKAVRLAGISTVFNKLRGGRGCLTIEKQEWEWAKAFSTYEYENISGALSGLSGEEQELDNAVFSIYNKIQSIISDDIGNSKCKVNKRYRDAKVIPYSKLKIACANNPSINSISDKTGRMTTGLDKVINLMVEHKALLILDRDPFDGRSPRLVKVLPGMIEFSKAYGE